MKYLALLSIVIMPALSGCNRQEPVVVSPAVTTEPASPQSTSGDQGARSSLDSKVVTDDKGRPVKVPPALP